MPQIDFGRAFKNIEDAQPTVQVPALDEVSVATLPAAITADAPEFRGRRLGRNHLANVIFVAVTVLGGLVCAFYFFNGADLIRAAAAWPAEFLYARPGDEPTPAKIDNQTSAANDVPGEGDVSATEQGPFRRTAQSLLEPNTQPQFTTTPQIAPDPGVTIPPVIAPPPVPSDPTALGQLAGTVPGGDALFRTLNEEAASLPRTAAATVNNATKAVTQTISQPPRRVITTVRKSARATKPPVTPRATTVRKVPARTQTNIAPLSTNAQLGLDKRGIGPGVPGGIGPAVLGGVGGGAGGGVGGAGGIGGGGGGIGAGGGIGGIGGALPGGLIGGRH